MEAVPVVQLIKVNKLSINKSFLIYYYLGGDKFGEIEAAQESAYFKKLVKKTMILN